MSANAPVVPADCPRETPSSHPLIGAFRLVRDRVCCQLNGERSVGEILILVTESVELPRKGLPSRINPDRPPTVCAEGSGRFEPRSGLLAPIAIPCRALVGGNGPRLPRGAGRNWVLAAVARAEALGVKPMRTSPFGNNTVRRGALQAFAADN